MPNSSEPVIESGCIYPKLLQLPIKTHILLVTASAAKQFLEYLENSGKKIGGAVFVSGWFTKGT